MHKPYPQVSTEEKKFLIFYPDQDQLGGGPNSLELCMQILHIAPKNHQEKKFGILLSRSGSRPSLMRTKPWLDPTWCKNMTQIQCTVL